MLAFASDGNRWWGVTLALVDAVIGIIVLSWPAIGLVTLAVFFAVTMIFRGSFAIVAGIKLRSLRNLDTAPVLQTATLA